MGRDLLDLAEQAEDAADMLATLAAGMGSGDMGEWPTEAVEGALIIMQHAQDTMRALVDGVRQQAQA